MPGVIRALGLLLLLLMAGCAGAPAPSASAPQTALLPPSTQPIQCVPYARQVSGVDLRGDAWTWWSQAASRYGRGSKPRLGAVLVFAKTSRLPLGHVSVVTRLVSGREILVTHANWASGSENRGRVTKDVRIIDVSPGNNWSELRVWNEDLDDFGLVYPAIGFIYPDAAAA
jgi:CHAP domain